MWRYSATPDLCKLWFLTQNYILDILYSNLSVVMEHLFFVEDCWQLPIIELCYENDLLIYVDILLYNLLWALITLIVWLFDLYWALIKGTLHLFFIIFIGYINTAYNKIERTPIIFCFDDAHYPSTHVLWIPNSTSSLCGHGPPSCGRWCHRSISYNDISEALCIEDHLALWKSCRGRRPHMSCDQPKGQKRNVEKKINKYFWTGARKLTLNSIKQYILELHM